ncbi:unannotated protein [freshwater metagenome]|uniref:Unannotated protein n=1 Tax=freshwater metagenome TaxID=449393 RepID=A0A6J5YLM6_9ZZZZ
MSEVNPGHRGLDRVHAERREFFDLGGDLVGSGEEHLTKGAGIDETQQATLGEGDGDMCVLGLGILGDRPQQLTRHAKVDDEHRAGVQREQQVLPLALRAGDLRPLEAGHEFSRLLSTDRALAGDHNGLDLLAHDLLLELSADGFNLGKFRHFAAHSAGGRCWRRRRHRPT